MVEFNNGVTVCFGSDNTHGNISTLTITLPTTYKMFFILTCMVKCGEGRDSGWANGIIAKTLSQVKIYQRDTGTTGMDYITIGF